MAHVRVVRRLVEVVVEMVLVEVEEGLVQLWEEVEVVGGSGGVGLRWVRRGGMAYTMPLAWLAQC